MSASITRRPASHSFRRRRVQWFACFALTSSLAVAVLPTLLGWQLQLGFTLSAAGKRSRNVRRALSLLLPWRHKACHARPVRPRHPLALLSLWLYPSLP